MYSSFQLAKKYFSYYLRASNSNGHGVHSPFVFDFVLNVLNNKNNYQPPAAIEELRSRLKSDHRLLEVEDFGAGSRKSSARERSVSQIAWAALKSKRLAQVLFRLVKHYQLQTIVELGTSLGLTTSYFSKANPEAKVVTIEGSPQIAQIAQENFLKLNSTNIQLIYGNFNDMLPSALSKLSAIDLGYVDGNHRYQPTINYFYQFLSKSHSQTILVFDDIHWSAEMEQAWEEIKQHPEVQYTIDIFFLGFVFFKPGFRVKQNFMIRF